MHSLGAIQPNRRCVVNHDRVCWRRRCCGGDWHEPRVEAGGAGHVHCNGLTGLREGGLCHGVVVGRELELYHVADIGLDIVRAVGQGAVCVADFHDMYGDLAGRHRSHGGGGCCCSESSADAQSRQGERCELHIGGLTKIQIQILNECGDMYKASSAVSCWPTIKITRSAGNVSVHLRPNEVKKEKNKRNR